MFERVEQKYFVSPSQMSLALALVRRACRWDDEYPEEQINSLYFDTPDLDQHERSLAGEYAKDKIRIRWYGTEHDPHRSREVATCGSQAVAHHEGAAVPVWLELKSRRGFVSTKQRRMVEVAAGALSPEQLARGIVPVNSVIHAMAGFGFFSPKRLLPVVAISYWRYRFIEPRTGFRVAFDTHVRSTVVIPGVGRAERGLELPGAVIEVKGASLDLPYPIRQLADMGSSWTRYSKYSSSLDAHAADIGGVSRLWPSGVIHAEPCTGIPKPDREGLACGTN